MHFGYKVAENGKAVEDGKPACMPPLYFKTIYCCCLYDCMHAVCLLFINALIRQ